MKPARIIVLGVAVVAAGAAAMLMSRPAAPPEKVVVERKAPVRTTDVLIAAADLPIGTTLKDGDLRWQPWPSDYVPPGSVTRQGGETLGDITGSIVRSGFLVGEPIRQEKLVKANSNAFMSAILPAGMRAVAISIDTRGSNTAGGFILPNDRVDIIRTYRDEEAAKLGGEGQSSETLLQNIRILAIGQNVQDKNGEKVVTGETATLEVSPAEAETLALAQKTGQLSLSLRSLADAGKAAETPEAKDDDANLTLIRYGISRQAARR
ncbi:Flp pilus assembly protein CpaB [Enterovirga rhinocerotis]|uniref:Pilus assembly protein CpaB n=1 Tax=Enterovirga rhinocerotis TaxID=1339210 RepID=A0A4R7C9H1_9HYPH|nr:Flp pilus assembly protein CpaB [Enterovirga rhinocerotis]TDR94692.1 pilus assembly protein CpaB [Enterovirga rhinocerotis]